MRRREYPAGRFVVTLRNGNSKADSLPALRGRHRGERLGRVVINAGATSRSRARRNR
jgi:hypothetical protein